MSAFRYILSVLFFSQSILCFSQTWNALGIDQNGCFAPSLKVWNNKLYGGGCISINNKMMNGVYSFDGVNYDSLDGGLASTGGAWAFTEHNNKLYVGGNFTGAGGLPNSARVAGWDGTSWSPTNSPSDFYTVYAVASYNGELYAGGTFIDMGSNPNADRIARWNGSAWNSVGAPMIGNQTVYAMAVYNGQLYVGGNVSVPGGPNNYYYQLVRWNGTKWDSVGGPLSPYWVTSLCVDTINNVLYAGGGFTNAAGVTAFGVAKWNDTVWSAVGSGTDTLWGTNSLKMFNGELYAGGSNSTITAQGDTLNNIYKWDGNKWVSPVGGGTNGNVRAMEVYNGNLYVGGDFYKAGTTGYLSSGGTVNANYIACYGNTCPQGVGIQELQVSGLKFRVFPNPAREEININVEGEGDKEYITIIYNSVGARITEQKFIKKTKVSTSSFSKGIYQVQVCNKDGKICHMEKVILE